jgi:hypothetical protein
MLRGLTTALSLFAIKRALTEWYQISLEVARNLPFR